MTKFQCFQTSGKRTVTWEGSFEITRWKPPYEMMVRARASRYHVIFGEHSFGNFLCIPDWNVGCEIADFTDTFWNLERLGKQLKKADAITIVYALAAADEHLKF